jgi:hypothetical protein
MMHSISLAVST